MEWLKDIKKSLSEFFGFKEEIKSTPVKAVKSVPSVTVITDFKELFKEDEVVTKVEEPVTKSKPKKNYKKSVKKSDPKKESVKKEKDAPKKSTKNKTDK